MKKVLPIIITILLFVFSFYYTNELVKIIKSNDPIMKMIKESEDYYQIKSVNALVHNDDTMEIGINGIVINTDLSYSKMKRYGSYNSSLLVYDEVKPKISLIQIKDKYIIGSLARKNNLSLLINVKDLKLIDKILDILEEKDIKVTFLLRGTDIKDNEALMKEISNNHSISSSDNSDEIYFTLVSLNKNHLPYCFVEYKDEKVKNQCQNNNMYTVLPTLIAKTKIYSQVKSKLRGGRVISFNLSENNLNELSMTINYIKQKGYKIIPVYELLNENYFN